MKTNPLSMLGAVAISAALLTTGGWFGDGALTYAQTGTPSAAQKKEAGQRFGRALELYREGNYRAALIEFRRANELAPRWETLFNIGQVQYQLQSYPASIEAFERYLREGGVRVDPERRATVENDLKKLRLRVARVMVKVDVAGAEVRINGELIGTAPLSEAALVSAGRLKIVVSKPNHLTETKMVDVAGGDVTDVIITLKAERGDGSGGLRPEPVPGGGSDPAGDIPWAAWGFTGGFAAAAVVFGVLALNSKGALDDAKQSVTSVDDLNNHRDRALAFGVTTDVLIAGAVVSGLVATVLTVNAGGAEEDAEGDTTGSAHVQLGVGPGSLMLFGTF